MPHRRNARFSWYIFRKFTDFLFSLFHIKHRVSDIPSFIFCNFLALLLHLWCKNKIIDIFLRCASSTMARWISSKFKKIVTFILVLNDRVTGDKFFVSRPIYNIGRKRPEKMFSDVYFFRLDLLNTSTSLKKSVDLNWIWSVNVSDRILSGSQCRNFKFTKY